MFAKLSSGEEIPLYATPLYAKSDTPPKWAKVCALAGLVALVAAALVCYLIISKTIPAFSGAHTVVLITVGIGLVGYLSGSLFITRHKNHGCVWDLVVLPSKLFAGILMIAYQNG